MLQDHIRLSAEPTIDTNLASIPYSNPRTGGPSGIVTNLEGAINYLFAALFPHYIGQFNTPLDLPELAEANDYAWVNDDGDGKAAGYIYVDVDGVAQWEKRYDVDWSIDNLLADILGQTHPLYVFLSGRPGGQHIFGGTATTENLQLNANSADDTGEIITHNLVRPSTDNTDDLGKLTERFKDLFIAGALKDGVESLTVANLKAAFDHISVVTGNPHAVTYDQLGNKLGTVTVDGDVSGSVDLSSSGNKTLTLAVGDDSHAHTKSTLTDFDTNVYLKVKAILQNADGLSFTANDVGETLTPAQADIDTSKITDIASPVDGKLLSSTTGSNWEARGLSVELTGEVTGSGVYSPITEKASFVTVVESVKLGVVDGIDLTNIEAELTLGNPSTITFTGHRLQTGMKALVVSTKHNEVSPALNDSYTITRIDDNNFTIPVETTASGTIYFIPENAQLLYDATVKKFIIRREYEEISHTELGSIDVNDDHAQYVRKEGRVGGQSIQGGSDDSDNLTLESTSSSVKGAVVTMDNFIPGDTASYSGSWSGVNLGSSAKKFNDLYMSGELKGGRVENLATTPSSSGQNKGRLVYNTVEDKLYYDNGLLFKPLSSNSIPTILEVFTAESGKAMDLSSVLDADKTTSDYGWLMMDATTSEQVPANITRSSSTTLTVTLEVPITGSFYIKGI